MIELPNIIIILIFAISASLLRAFLFIRKKKIVQILAWGLLGAIIGVPAALTNSSFAIFGEFTAEHLSYRSAENYIENLTTEPSLKKILGKQYRVLRSSLKDIPKGHFTVYNDDVTKTWKGIMNSAFGNVVVINSLSSKDWEQICKNDKGCVQFQNDLTPRVEICRIHIYSSHNKQDLQSLGSKQKKEAGVIPVYVPKSKISNSDLYSSSIKRLQGFKTILLADQNILMRFEIHSISQRLKQAEIDFRNELNTGLFHYAEDYFCFLYEYRDSPKTTQCQTLKNICEKD